jgi:2-furoyl-CoA dehydrogenase large subunit
VAAEERNIAEEAVGLIEIKYEPSPAVFDPSEAMRADAPLIHPQRIRSGSLP